MPIDFQQLDLETRQVAKAMALLWSSRSRAAILAIVRSLGYRRDTGAPLRLPDISTAIAQLQALGLVVEQSEREGMVRLVDPLRIGLYAELLSETMGVDLRRALHEAEKIGQRPLLPEWPLTDFGASVAVFRLAVFTGTPADKLDALGEAIAAQLDWPALVDEAVFAGFSPGLARNIDPAWRPRLISLAALRAAREWQAGGMPVVRWALSFPPDDWPETQRQDLAELCLLRGEAEEAGALLAGVDSGEADALRACLLIQAKEYAEGIAGFEAALKRCQDERSARKRLLPPDIAWHYPLALLASHSPPLLETALKFCIGEAGERSPPPDRGWGIWAHATAVRLGETTLDPDAFRPRDGANLDELWRLLAAAWLGVDGETGKRLENAAILLHAALRPCGLAWLERLVREAETTLHGHAPGETGVLVEEAAPWKDVLASLQALAEETPADEAERRRLLWVLRISPDGELEEIEPREQKLGQRGWSTPHPVSLGGLAGDETLAPRDALVARALRPDPDNPRHFTLDRAAAIGALVEHPFVTLADAPDQPIELVEAQPEIETVRAGSGYIVRIRPPLREGSDDGDGLGHITLLRESPQRVRLIRFSPAQCRAARLIGDGLTLPVDAENALKTTLQTLTPHFLIEGEQARGERQVAADARLRAELSPVGEALMLRLVVAPLGPDGPRLVPARGRARLLAGIGGEALGTRRELAAERANLDAVLDAFDFLDEEAAENCQWLIAQPEHGLELLDRLPQLPAIAALEWPKGQPVRVVGVDRGKLRLRLRPDGHGGYLLNGRVEPLPGTIVQLPELLAAARGDSRFVPLGEGLYLALTRELKQRLADIAALTEGSGKGQRLPAWAGIWLEDLLEGLSVKVDPEAQGSLERLRRLEETDPALPAGLAADLRPYQEEGFRWAMRLAAAGFGGCLADDMGLGKTLQTIAVLLARSEAGPALILAPTSLTGNWQAELERFAPGLEIRFYGDEREAALGTAGPGCVVIASYGLFLADSAAFEAVKWHTLIADEAQAIKNAEAKRTQATLGLPANFRLALTGTPVENRLSELWSIMHFANPGLLGSLESFNKRFAAPIEKQRDRAAQRALRRLVSPFILRRTKTQVLQELPPRTDKLLIIQPEREETAHYQQLRHAALETASRLLADDPN